MRAIQTLCILALVFALSGVAQAGVTFNIENGVLKVGYDEWEGACKKKKEACGKLKEWVLKQTPFLTGDACYRGSYTQKAKGIPDRCPGEDKDGALCYPKCRSGYKGEGPVCWEKCRSGYTNIGVACYKDGDTTNANTSSCPWYNKLGWNSNCVKCPSGYSNTGMGFCAKAPDAYFKDSYGRGAGSLLKCRSGYEKRAGLCYKKCKKGYEGESFVCWQDCPSLKPTNCGMTCAKDTKACVFDAMSKVASVAICAAKIGAMIMSAGSSAAATSAAETASKWAKIKKAWKAAKNLYERTKVLKNKLMMLKASAKAVYDTSMHGKLHGTLENYLLSKGYKKKYIADVFNSAAMTMSAISLSHELGEMAASMLSLVDPTGVVFVVNAFADPMCLTPPPALSALK